MELDSLTGLTVVLAAAVIAPFVTYRLAPRFTVPSVVVEILLGIVAGPALLDLVQEDDVVAALSDLGLAFLMFLAGYEVPLARIRGGPLRRAVTGWLISLVVAVSAGLLLGGITGLVVGLALATTALGTILPIIRDSGDAATPFGNRVLAVGAVGEFGPILAIAFALSGERPAHTVAVLAVFTALALAGAWLARQPRHPRLGHVISATLGTSAQVAVRLCVFVVVGMFAFAQWLGLDPVLGAFTAGLLIHLFIESSDEHEAEVVQSRLEGIGFGFFIPIFFVVSGVNLDVESLVSDPAALGTVPIYLGLFVVVRGIPTYLTHRSVLTGDDRLALAALASTALPLVVVITTLGVEEGVLSATRAAALVTAGLVSVLAFPALALRLRRRRSGATA